MKPWFGSGPIILGGDGGGGEGGSSGGSSGDLTSPAPWDGWNLDETSGTFEALSGDPDMALTLSGPGAVRGIGPATGPDGIIVSGAERLLSAAFVAPSSSRRCSFTAWVTPRDLGGIRHIVAAATSSFAEPYGIALGQVDGKARGYVTTTASPGGHQLLVASVATILANARQLLALVFDGDASPSLRLYHGHTLVASSTPTGTDLNWSVAASWSLLGRNNGGNTSEGWVGGADSVRIYDGIALTPEQLAEIVERGAPR